MTSTEKIKLRDEIKERVGIAVYFDEIILPEMADYYSDYTVDFDARPVAKCPLHHEDTPSFRYYEDTETFYCFGCRAAGDVINLHRLFVQERNGVKPSFEEALLFMSHYFIKGQVDEVISAGGQEVKRKATQTEKPLSTNVEMMLFNRKISDTSRLLEVESKIPLKTKIDLYKILDELVSLVELNIIPAVGAKEYLTREVNRLIYGR